MPAIGCFQELIGWIESEARPIYPFHPYGLQFAILHLRSARLISSEPGNIPEMLTFKLATGDQYETFFQLMLNEASDYLLRTMELMHMTLEQARHLFEHVGQVYGIYEDDKSVGFYWIEERYKVLHLHGLVLREEFQGKGIGTQVLKMLESEYGPRVAAIELGVHQSNEKAKRLYERMGFQTVIYRSELGFYIMRKSLHDDPA